MVSYAISFEYDPGDVFVKYESFIFYLKILNQNKVVKLSLFKFLFYKCIMIYEEKIEK